MPSSSDSPIRVLCVTDACDQPESELFIGLQRAGIEVEVVCNPKGKYYERLQQAGLSVTPLKLNGRFDREGTATIRQRLQEGRHQILHAWNPRALACGLRARRGMEVRIAAYRGVSGNISFLNPESWITFLNPRVDRIVSVCDAVRDYLRKVHLLGWRIPEEKLSRIYKGHDLGWYNAQPADLSEFGIPEDAFVICATGRDRPRKGFDVLVRAAGECSDLEDVHFLLVGDMVNNDKLRADAEACANGHRIHFAGYRDDAPELAAASNVFVLPSTEREGLPRAVIEAMAYGVTPVVTDVGGMPELVANGETGLVVPCSDAEGLARAIRRLQGDRQWNHATGRKAQERIGKHFHTSQTVHQTAALYRELTAGR